MHERSVPAQVSNSWYRERRQRRFGGPYIYDYRDCKVSPTMADNGNGASIVIDRKIVAEGVEGYACQIRQE